MGKKVKLHHKLYDGLAFGAESEIQFGMRGGFEPGYLVIDEEHPLYDALWAAEGANLEVVDETGPARVYVSPLEPDREFKSRPALLAHIRAAAKKGNKLAIAWLEANGDVKDDPDAPDDTE